MIDGLRTHSRRYLTGSFAPPPIVLSFMVVQPLSICYFAALADLTFGCFCALNTSASA